MSKLDNAIAVRRDKTEIMALLSSSLEPLVKHAARNNVELRIEARGDIPPAAVDRNKLAWCITTLAGNALRYLGRDEHAVAGGTILVHVEHEPGAPAMVAISVHDDGPGIPPAILPYLFESRKGVLHADGLALTLIREIVAAHSGRLEVHTQTGREAHGTSITLRVPVDAKSPS